MSGRLLAWMFATFGAVTAQAQTSIALPGDLIGAVARRSLTRPGSCEHVESLRETFAGRRITVGTGLFVGSSRHGRDHASDGDLDCRIIV